MKFSVHIYIYTTCHTHTCSIRIVVIREQWTCPVMRCVLTNIPNGKGVESRKVSIL